MKKYPEIKKLNSMFSYNEESGIVIRKLRAGRRGLVGAVVGSLSHGYLEVRIDKENYRLHRIIWIMKFGFIDENLQIDHINGIRDDNRIKNLRLVPHKDNGKNVKMHNTNTSGITGVYWDNANNNWKASICVNGKSNHIGSYETILEAATARKLSEGKFGFHKNHGRAAIQ